MITYPYLKLFSKLALALYPVLVYSAGLPDQPQVPLRPTFEVHSGSSQPPGHNKSQVGDEATYHIATHPSTSFSDYQIRVSSTGSNLCDPDVRQVSGYLDISDGRHLFFWFFEARNSPETAPLMLWLNGGPGCSSIGNGLLFEHGPCLINPADKGNSTVYNGFSWNEVANIIYLDQPVGTGYSYSSDGSRVNTHVDLAKDVYAFLQIFYHRYPKYASLPFHVAAESWGGHYGPAIANLIYRKNKDLLASSPTGAVPINLHSVIIANGFTDPVSQYEAHTDYVCGGAPYPVFNPNGPVCIAMRATTPVCLGLLSACYKYPSRLTCMSAQRVCWDVLMPPPFLRPLSSKNQYDIRQECEPSETQLCYKEFDWIGAWLDQPTVKKAIGAEVGRKFTDCDITIQYDFNSQAQAVQESSAFLPELVNGGVRLLAFAGDVDAACNYIGIERWMTKLGHDFHAEFEQSPSLFWQPKGSNGPAGVVRTAGGNGMTSGNVTFIRVYEAGHMAPHDQPEASLDMISRWLKDLPFVD